MSTAVLTHSAFGRRSTVAGPAVRSAAVPIARAARVETQPSTHLRLTRRGRLAITIAVAAPIAIAAVSFAVNGGIAAATVEAAPVTFSYVQVAAGDSLWQIAQSIAPEADPREVVSDLVQLNQLTSVVVQPGQRLAIPMAYNG